MCEVRDPVFCRYETTSFPRSEFRVDPLWGLVHEVEPEHNTMGDPIAEEPREWQIEIPGSHRP